MTGEERCTVGAVAICGIPDACVTAAGSLDIAESVVWTRSLHQLGPLALLQQLWRRIDIVAVVQVRMLRAARQAVSALADFSEVASLSWEETTAVQVQEHEGSKTASCVLRVVMSFKQQAHE